MKILVSGPVNYDYSQYIVQEIQRLGHTVFLYPMKDFYRYCSYLERKAYKLGKGLIPIQLYKEFKNNEESTKLGEIIPNTMGEYKFADLNKIFSKEITDSIKEGIENFNKKIKGFAREDAILLGVESRTSSPIIIERDENKESNIKGIYPCGEGAGYAGGITTAAIDGIKVAEEIAKKYKTNMI